MKYIIGNTLWILYRLSQILFIPIHFIWDFKVHIPWKEEYETERTGLYFYRSFVDWIHCNKCIYADNRDPSYYFKERNKYLGR